jgi:hypothetical protein
LNAISDPTAIFQSALYHADPARPDPIARHHVGMQPAVAVFNIQLVMTRILR